MHPSSLQEFRMRGLWRSACDAPAKHVTGYDLILPASYLLLRIGPPFPQVASWE
jgi:hypothetical protein